MREGSSQAGACATTQAATESGRNRVQGCSDRLSLAPMANASRPRRYAQHVDEA
jgi:hypothetical protein